MCLLLALSLPRVYLQWPLTVLTRQTWQAVYPNNTDKYRPPPLSGHRRSPEWKPVCGRFNLPPGANLTNLIFHGHLTQ